MEHLSIEAEEEELEILFEENQETNEDLALFLVGRFLTDRPIRFHMMKLKMAEFWNPVCRVSIKEVECNKNLFLFKFFHPRDLERVLKQGPWSFDGHTLVLGLLQQGTAPSTVPLNHIPMWVQVHDVPVGCMSATAGKQLGNCIGEFMEYDDKHNSNFLSTFMRIRVLIDVRKPLMRLKKIKTKGGSHEVKFKYEKLGSFCYYCGMLGHIDDFCSNLYANPNDDGVRLWNPELRATTRKNAGIGIGSSSKWLREETSNVRVTATAAQSCKTVTDEGIKEQSKTSIIINKSGDTISLVEAFTKPNLLFPNYLQKSVTATPKIAINKGEDSEVEIDCALKKRFRTIQEPIEGALNGMTKGGHTLDAANKKFNAPIANSSHHVLHATHDPMDDVQHAITTPHNVDNKMHPFLREGSGHQTHQDQ